jgi:hypothetical protein
VADGGTPNIVHFKLYSIWIHVLKELMPGSVNFGTRAQTPDGLRGILEGMLKVLRGVEEIAMNTDDP